MDRAQAAEDNDNGDSTPLQYRCSVQHADGSLHPTWIDVATVRKRALSAEVAFLEQMAQSCPSDILHHVAVPVRGTAPDTRGASRFATLTVCEDARQGGASMNSPRRPSATSHPETSF